MQLPILSYGHTLLRQKCRPIATDFPDLDALIDDLWETMYQANGCGLAAPQVGKPIQLFVIDSKAMYESYSPEDRALYFPSDEGIIETFINARIIEQSPEIWKEEEGCLSIPNVFQNVDRPWSITLEYQDRGFVNHTKTFGGVTARMIQHECDHTAGILFLDYLRPLTKKMLEGKLRKIASGKLPATYPMVYRK